MLYALTIPFILFDIMNEYFNTVQTTIFCWSQRICTFGCEGHIWRNNCKTKL